jgi:hypothetical protein
MAGVLVFLSLPIKEVIMKVLMSWHFTLVVLCVILGLFVLMGIIVLFIALVSKIKTLKARKG